MSTAPRTATVSSDSQYVSDRPNTSVQTSKINTFANILRPTLGSSAIWVSTIPLNHGTARHGATEESCPGSAGFEDILCEHWKQCRRATQQQHQEGERYSAKYNLLRINVSQPGEQR